MASASVGSTEAAQVHELVLKQVHQLRLGSAGIGEYEQQAISAAEILRDLTAMCSISRAVLVEVEGPMMLRHVLNNRVHTQPLHRLASEILLNLALDSDSKDELGCAIAPLLALLRTPDTTQEVALSAVQALKAITHSNQQNSDLCKQLGGVVVMVQLLGFNCSPSSNGGLVTAVLLLLHSLAWHREVTPMSARAMVGYLVQLLGHNTPSVMRAAMMIISDYAADGILHNTAGPSLLVDAGTLTALLNLAGSTGNDVDTRILILRLFLALIVEQHSKTQPVSLDSEGAKYIVRLLSSSSNTEGSIEAVHLVLRLLRFLLDNMDTSYAEQLAADVIAADGIAVLHNLQHPSASTSPTVGPCGVIYKLLALSEAPAVSALQQLLRDSSTQHQARRTWSLRALALVERQSASTREATATAELMGPSDVTTPDAEEAGSATALQAVALLQDLATELQHSVTFECVHVPPALPLHDDGELQPAVAASMGTDGSSLDESYTDEAASSVASPHNHSAHKEPKEAFSGRCVICYVGTPRVLYLPCSHLAVCAVCADLLNAYKTGSTCHEVICPICRIVIEKQMRILYIGEIDDQAAYANDAAVYANDVD